MSETAESHICKSCGNGFTGLYCNLCGEKVVLPADRSFRKLLSNILVAITFADSKVFRTLWLVISRPGFVSREFTEGRTVRYLPPLSLFFVLNLVYFLFPLIQLFNASLTTQLSSYFYGRLAGEFIAIRMADMRLDLNAFQLLYNESTISYAKLLVVLFAILASLPLNLLFRRSGRFFADHIGLMVELACFNLLINALLVTFLAKLLPIGGFLDEVVLTVLFIMTNFYFLWHANRTFYSAAGWKLLAKTIVTVGFLKIALEAYRLILFLVTMLALA